MAEETQRRLVVQLHDIVVSRKGLNLKFVCDNAEVSYQTVRRSILEGKGIKEKTLMTLAEELDMKFILIDKKL